MENVSAISLSSQRPRCFNNVILHLNKIILKSRRRSKLFVLHSAMREPSLSERVENHGNS